MPTANNYDPEALIDDGSCEVTVHESSCSVDLDGDGTVATGDLFDVPYRIWRGVLLKGGFSPAMCSFNIRKVTCVA